MATSELAQGTPESLLPKPARRPRRVSAAPATDFSSPDLYLNRELTWLSFNERVLAEGSDSRTPLLERLKFVAIVSSNLDEFFMKRIGGLKQQVGAGMRNLTVDGRTPAQQIRECCEVVDLLEQRKRVVLEEITHLLAEKGITIVPYVSLTATERRSQRKFFYTNIYPLVTPQAIDPAHPFPFISNLSLNLLVTLRYRQEKEVSLARVKVPVGQGVPRYLRVGSADRFVSLEDVMCNNLDIIFPGMEVVACEIFRVTRNANTEKNEEQADDLMSLIESELQDRKFAPIVRLQVQEGMDPARRGMLAAELGLDEASDVVHVPGMMAMRDLFEIAALDHPRLHYPPHHPVDHPRLVAKRNIFHSIRDAGSILLQHPYESFTTSVERFLQEAAEDPKVRAIKMTLYRTGAESRIIDHLIDAAENGKQVAVVVELKARFDEATNIRLAEKMEEAGIHVTYGVMGLKTHCKVILVVRQDYSGLRRYVHIGTGNYHAGTARLYCDMGLLTADDRIGQDATELFNYLTTGFTPKRKYRKLLPAPKLLKKALLEKISRETSLHTHKKPGHIIFKMNALEDADIVRALYEASAAGVKVDLIVRDSCRLRPGIRGLSETARVVSVVGRFLEHSRIYYFRNGGVEEFYMGSADAMKRNLEDRVEVLVPIDDEDARRDVRRVLDIHLTDRRSAWEMGSDGTYVRVEGEGAGSHEALIAQTEKRLKEAARLKKRKVKPVKPRNVRLK